MDLRNKSIVAVVAHPDDETIGCGGFLSKAVSQQANVKVVLPLKRADQRGITHWQSLLQQFSNACHRLGATPIVTPDPADDLVADLNIQKICNAIHPFIEEADIVLTHWHGDTHQAHRALARAVELSTRPFRNPKTVLCFEVATSTDQGFVNSFSPNFYVSLSEKDMTNKKLAMAEYKTEIIAGRTPENLEIQMRLRGSQMNSAYAEAFVIARYFLQ